MNQSLLKVKPKRQTSKKCAFSSSACLAHAQLFHCQCLDTHHIHPSFQCGQTSSCLGHRSIFASEAVDALLICGCVSASGPVPASTRLWPSSLSSLSSSSWTCPEAYPPVFGFAGMASDQRKQELKQPRAAGSKRSKRL